jgi:hypothetical protein
MSKDKDQKHSICFPDSEKKKAERIAALLDLDEWYHSFGIGINLALAHAEASFKGFTRVVSCTPRLADLIESNPEFIEALCEEGVVEWLTPFVLAKPKQSNHPAPDTTQP